ncbi:MAG: Gldg family protein [Myxococcaceae bacterium]
MNARSGLLTAVTVLGLVAVFLGERVVSAGSLRVVLDVLGVLAVVAAAVLRWNRSAVTGAAGPRARVERVFAVLSTLALLTLLTWFAQSDVIVALGGPDVRKSAPRLATVLQLATALLAALTIVPLLLGELAYAAMGLAPEVEVGRVQDAVGTGVALVSVLVTALALGWVADVRDLSADWSYFRPGRPSESTRGLVRGLTEPVTLSLFYPPGSEVGAAARDYAESLARESPLLRIERLDAAVDLRRARALGVNGNGALAVSRGERHETYLTGDALDSSKSQLRELDPEVQRRLSLVGRAARVVYVTTGHGERAATNADPSDPRGTVRAFQELLRAQNDEVRPLGAAQGLATEVPRDASAVLVLGPTTPFVREEVEALVRYVRGGGRLLVALDPESGSQFDALLQPLGVRFVPTPLVNDRVYLARTHQPSDRGQLVTASFGPHASVGSLVRANGRLPLFLLGTGSIELLSQKPAGVNVVFTVMTLAETFRDLDGNFVFDPKTEKRRAWDVAAAITLPRKGGDDGRAVVVADSDAFTDLVLDASGGNRSFALDGVRWLLGEESLGAPGGETDFPIQHTRGQEVAWFYVTVFGAPLAVLGAGFWATRRRRRR